MKAVVFLQNAWSPLYAGGTWPRKSWLQALHRSRSGQRLSVLSRNCTGVELWFDNTTPIVGEEPDSVVKPDFGHIRQVMREHNPDYVVACGRQAAEAITKSKVSFRQLMILPHPAYRVLTNSLYEKAGALLLAGFTGIVELVQKKGFVQVIHPGANPIPTIPCGPFHASCYCD
jgi:hypothetical protein